MEKLIEFEIEKMYKIFKDNNYDKEQKLLFIEAKEKMNSVINNVIVLKACSIVKEEILKEN